MSRFYTSADIQALLRDGKSELVMHEGDKLTDIAREMLKQRRIPIVTGEVRPEAPAPAGRAEPAPAWKTEPAPRVLPSKAAAERPADGKAAYDLVIAGGTCVVPEMGRIQANVCIRDGKVAALTTDLPAAQQVIDATGLYVLPGIVDPHTHIGLFVPFEEELETESRSAILGGVTTIGTYFNQVGSYLPLMDQIERSVAGLSRVDMIPHFTLRDETQLQELPLYSQRGMNSYKVYMCGVPGLFPHQEDGFIIRAMERMKGLPPWANPILSVHCENTSICDYATADMEREQLQTLEDWNRTHPNLAEGEAVLRSAYFAKKMGVRTYVVHSSTKEAMEALQTAKHPNLFVETTSPYLTLDTDSDIGAYGKMLPPIREPASRQALWDSVRSGVIDTIGTDNTVMTTEEKKVAAGMRGAGAGYPTLGTHLASVLTEGVFRQEVPLETLVPLLTMNPARIFGVYPRKGTIMPGSDADLVLVDLSSSKTVDPAALLSRSDFSLFQGKTLRAWPRATIKGGRIVAWDGRLTDDGGRGCVLKH